MPTTITIMFVFYIAIICVIAVVANRRTRTHTGFILANRQLGPWATALGAGASDMGGWLVMALPGAMFAFGLQTIWLPLGLSLGAYLNWHLVAKRLHDRSISCNDSQTIPSFFYNRFNGESKGIKVVASLVILIFFTLYISAGFVSGALLMQSTFGWDYSTALLVGAGIIVAYSTIGGFLAVNWVDIFQGLLMLAAFVIVAGIIMQSIGSFNGIHTYYQTHNPHYFDIFNNVSLIGCISSMAWGLGYFGQPHILIRFMAARDAEKIKISRRICMTWMILSLMAASLIGIAGSVYFNGQLDNPETVFLKLIEVALNPWVAGLLFSAVLSAVMSTVAAQLIGSCSTITEDLHSVFSKQARTDKKALLANRAVLILVSFASLLLALDPHTSLLSLVGYAWGGFGAAFGPVILFSLYSKKLTANAAAMSMIVGTIVTIVWHMLGVSAADDSIFKLYEIVPGFAANWATMLLMGAIKPAEAI